MSIFERVGELFACKDKAVHADALVVLGGGDFDLRLSAGLSLLRRGYAPRLAITQSSYHQGQHRTARAAAKELPDQVFLVACSAASTAQEAEEVCRALRRWDCVNVTIVTSWYHARRARMIFSRVLRKHEIRVTAYPVAIPSVPLRCWWKTKAGRRTLAIEASKFLVEWLHLDFAGVYDLRFRVKEWLHASALPPIPELVKVWEGPQEDLTASLQSYLQHVRLAGAAFGDFQLPTQGSPTAGGSALSSSPGAQKETESIENGAEAMQGRTFKAITLTAPDNKGRGALADAFNQWAEKAQPASIVHVHYYHDERGHLRGYQIIFEPPEKAEVRQMPAREEPRAA